MALCYVVFILNFQFLLLLKILIFFFFLFQDGEFHDIVYNGHKLEFLYGHMFDAVIVNDDLLRAFQELLHVIKLVETVPQWVPASWVASS